MQAGWERAEMMCWSWQGPRYEVLDKASALDTNGSDLLHVNPADNDEEPYSTGYDMMTKSNKSTS